MALASSFGDCRAHADLRGHARRDQNQFASGDSCLAGVGIRAAEVSVPVPVFVRPRGRGVDPHGGASSPRTIRAFVSCRCAWQSDQQAVPSCVRACRRGSRSWVMNAIVVGIETIEITSGLGRSGRASGPGPSGLSSSQSCLPPANCAARRPPRRQ